VKAHHQSDSDDRPGDARAMTAADVHLRFERILDSLNAICDDLEHVADLLPHSVDQQFCLSVARRLPLCVQSAHEFEEKHVFALVGKPRPMVEPSASTLERLRFEHWGDQDYAHDVGHALREFIRVQDKTRTDALAWMLRGFFDGLRRHIAFDRAFILPQIAARAAAETSKRGD
jgi:hemerythrin-like domain-containing protein